MSEKTDKNANRIFEKIIPALKIVLVLLIIFCIASTFYKTRSVRLLINLLIGIPVVLIFARYMKLFFGTSENYTSADIGYKSQYTDSRFENVTSVLKKIWVVMILLSIVSIVYLFNSFVTAMHSHPDGSFPSKIDIKIGYRNAPEGTVYVDVLGKIDSSDETYTDFNVAPQEIENGNSTKYDYLTDGEPLDIDENSEIARYNEDGYMSLSIHSTDVRLYDLDGDGCDRLILNWNGSGFYKKYGKYKIAYVGEHGEVLGVTKKASHSYDPNESNSVFANGDKATYSEEAEPPAFYVSVAIILITIALTVIVIPLSIIMRIIEMARWKRYVRETAHRSADRNNDN